MFLLVALVIAAIGATRTGWIASAVAAGITIGLIGLTTWFVFSEDGYVQNGSSKWDTRSSVAHDIYIASIAVGCLLVALYTVLAARRMKGAIVSTAIAVGGVLEAFGVLVLVLTFGSN